MENKEIHEFIQKMMDKIVQFYYIEVKKEFGGEGYDTNEESFTRAINIVISTAFVSADSDNSRLFLYALDPSAFIPFSSSGECEMWNFLRDWAKESYKISIAIGKFEMTEPKGISIYQDTKNYLLESKRMVDDEVSTFEDSFLNAG